MTTAEAAQGSAGSPLLQASGLTVYRGDAPLFADISLSLFAGEVLQIDGSNGVGKTTLLRVLCGLAQADEGEVFWRGKNLRSQQAVFSAQSIYLGHKPGIKAELSACENLRFYQQLGQHSDAQLYQLLDTVGVSARADLPCGVLSAGQKRRVALARLLLTPARLWILDEPLTSLDSEGREMVLRLLTRHVSAGGALLYTTHQPLPFADLNVRSLRLGASAGAGPGAGEAGQ